MTVNFLAPEFAESAGSVVLQKKIPYEILRWPQPG